MHFITWNVFLNFFLTHFEKYNTGVMYLPWAYDFTMWVRIALLLFNFFMPIVQCSFTITIIAPAHLLDIDFDVRMNAVCFLPHPLLPISTGSDNHINVDRAIWHQYVENIMAIWINHGSTLWNYFICQWLVDQPSIHCIPYRDVVPKTNRQNATIHRSHSTAHTIYQYVRYHICLGIIFSQQYLLLGTTYALSTIRNGILEHFRKFIIYSLHTHTHTYFKLTWI